MIILVIMRRKTVSRKKPAHKTKRRSRSRARGRSHAHGSRRTRVKRGGMMGTRAAAAAAAREAAAAAAREAAAREAAARAAIHPPILNEFQQSLQDAITEVKDPVKTFDKGKALYDKFQQGLDEEKRKQQNKENSRKPKQSTALPFPPLYDVSPFSLQSQNIPTPTQGTQGLDIHSVIKQPFSTPNSIRNQQYSSQTLTPQHLQPKSNLKLLKNGDEWPPSSQSPPFNRLGQLNLDPDASDDDVEGDGTSSGL